MQMSYEQGIPSSSEILVESLIWKEIKMEHLGAKGGSS